MFIKAGEIKVERDVNRIIVTVIEHRGDQEITASINLHPDQAFALELALRRFGTEAKKIDGLQNPVHL